MPATATATPPSPRVRGGRTRPRPRLTRPSIPGTATAVAAALVVSLAAACTGSNGAGGDSPQDVLNNARKALQTASSVHVTGSLLNQGEPVQLDVRVVGTGADGMITADGQTYHILRFGPTVYLKGDASLYTSALATPGGTPPVDAKTLATRYVVIPSSDRLYALAVHMTSADTLFNDALPKTGTAQKNGQKSIRGANAMVITIGGAEADIALDGPPYPLQVTMPTAAGAGGVLNFAEFGAPTALTPPPPTAILNPDGTSALPAPAPAQPTTPAAAG